MESTQFQTTNSKPLELQTNVVRKAQNLVATSSLSTAQLNTSNLNTLTSIASLSEQAATINTQSKSTTINVTSNNHVQQTNSTITTTANLIASTISNGQQQTTLTSAPQQQIIQVSSQGNAILPGQQLMVQTLSGRPAIQLRAAQAGQQFQQIQLIPFGNLQGQNQRPVIIQTPGNVLHSASGTTITSMANLTHNNVAKITSVGSANQNVLTSSTNLNLAHHQKPVIIQQAAGQFIHSANAQPHNLHGHNVTKIATVGRAPARTNAVGGIAGNLTTQQQQQQTTSKMILHSTNATLTNNHHTVQAQQNHLTNNTANPQQVTRLNIISSLPSGVHTSVSNVAHNAATGGKPILSLATATLNKPLIINPASSVVQPSIVGNVVNMSNFNAASHQLKQSNTAANLIPTVMTLTTLTTSSGSLPGRHTMITSTNHHSQHHLPYQQATTNIQQQQRLTVASNSLNNNANLATNPQLLINHNSSSNSINNLNLTQQISSNLQSTIPINHQQQQQPSSISRSNLLTGSSTSNTLNSPIKQLPQGTPSSPRPSILIRYVYLSIFFLNFNINY